MSEMSLGLSTFTSEATRPEQRRQFFDVSLLKLLVMSTVTFNLYQIYWFYKHWQTIKTRGEDVWPLPRAIFAVLFAHALFKETVEVGRAASVEIATRPGAHALAFFLLQLAWRLPDPFWLLGFATVLPLTAMQKDVRRIHVALGLDPSINDRLTWKNTVGIVLGVIWILLIIVGLLVPDNAG